MESAGQALWAWIRATLETLPTFWEGFVAGLIGSIAWSIVASRWAIIRRKRRPPEEE